MRRTEDPSWKKDARAQRFGGPSSGGGQGVFLDTLANVKKRLSAQARNDIIDNEQELHVLFDHLNEKMAKLTEDQASFDGLERDYRLLTRSVTSRGRSDMLCIASYKAAAGAALSAGTLDQFLVYLNQLIYHIPRMLSDVTKELKSTPESATPDEKRALQNLEDDFCVYGGLHALYFISVRPNTAEVVKILLRMDERFRKSHQVQFSLSIFRALSACNYAKFFRLYNACGGAVKVLLQPCVERVRGEALARIQASYNMLDVQYLTDLLAFDNCKDCSYFVAMQFPAIKHDLNADTIKFKV